MLSAHELSLLRRSARSAVAISLVLFVIPAHALEGHEQPRASPSHDHADHDPQENHEAKTAAESHDHADHNREATGFANVVKWIGKFHPPTVQFPIALLVAAAAAEVLFIIIGKPQFEHAGWFCLAFGMVTAIAAAILGWCFGGFHVIDADWLLTTHRWLGTSTVAWAVMLGWLGYKTLRSGGPKWRLRYRIALFIGAALVSATGFFGGALIYGLDHYAW